MDSDNGGEFINDQLIRYCSREHLTFTRGRVAHKNDNAYIEQNNWSVVRRLVGYDRYCTPIQVRLLTQLYAVYRLYVNFFLPITKLVRKDRDGSRVIKVYDAPATPYQRVLDSPAVDDSVNLKLQIDTLKEKLMRSVL